MLPFLKHIFQKHGHYVFAILTLILIISVLPHQDISTVHNININAAIAKRVMAIGKVFFEGTGSGYLELKGRYQGKAKAVYNIVINGEVNGVQSFQWNKDNGSYITNLLTDKDYELSDGIIIKFNPSLAYFPGDNWTINAGIPAKFNLAEANFLNLGRQITSLYSNFSQAINQLAIYISDLFSPQSNLALRKAISGGSLVTTVSNNNSLIRFGTDKTALVDMAIVSTEVKNENNKVLPVLALALIVLILLATIIYLVKKIKNRGTDHEKMYKD